MTTVLVAGAIANKHRHGGSAWVRMSWAEALRDAGLDVVVVEQIDEAACVDAAGRPAPFERSANLAAFRAVTEAFGFAGSAALVCPGRGLIDGMAEDALFAAADDAALLVNIGGHLRWPALVDRVEHRAFIDLDPGYTQVWAAEGRDVGLAGHALHFTVGTNVGTPRCDLPTGGLDWHPIRQPVSLERWPWADGDELGAFTTVASWRGAYGPLTWQGRTLGVKAHEFRRFAELPRAVDVPFAVALDIHRGDEPTPRACAPAVGAARPRTPWRRPPPSSASCRRPARSSPPRRARTSPRAAAGSATARSATSRRAPGLVQDTGFTGELPTGEGLVAFTTPEEAAEGARAIAADYPRHRRAARRLAETHFASARAIAPLLEASGLAVAA
jgi:hypothetical protein